MSVGLGVASNLQGCLPRLEEIIGDATEGSMGIAASRVNPWVYGGLKA